MNQYQGTTSGQGILKDYYDESKSPLEVALEKRRKKRRKNSLLPNEMSEEDKLIEDIFRER